MKSKTKISKQLLKKNNPELVKTILMAKKNENWFRIASVLSGPRKNRLNLNLDEIETKTKDGERIVLSGKVLSQGQINKKIEVVAFSFSEAARDKMKKSGIKFNTLIEEIKKNPDAKGLRILG